MSKYNLVAILPVKGNSERVEKKNIRPFADTNLLELKLNQIENTVSIESVLVSSESDEVLDFAKNFKKVIIHKRDEYYSSSTVPMSEVYRHLAQKIDSQHVIWTQVTSPLVNSKIYKESLQIYFDMEKKYDSLLSCSKVSEYLLKNYRPLNFTRAPWMKSQDLKGIHRINFAVNILSTENLIKWGSLVGENPYYIELDRDASTDIDYQEDFDFCEFLYKKNPQKYL